MNPALPQPCLPQIVSEASHALAALDAERLEELAKSCRILNRSIADTVPSVTAVDRARTLTELAVLRRILDATRRNLKVLHHLEEMRAARLEYRAVAESPWPSSGAVHREEHHGDN